MYFTLDCLTRDPEWVLLLQASDPLEMLFPLSSVLQSQEPFTFLFTPVEGCLSVKASFMGVWSIQLHRVLCLVMVPLLIKFEEKEPPSHLVQDLAGVITFQHRHYLFPQDLSKGDGGRTIPPQGFVISHRWTGTMIHPPPYSCSKLMWVTSVKITKCWANACADGPAAPRLIFITSLFISISQI